MPGNKALRFLPDVAVERCLQSSFLIPGSMTNRDLTASQSVPFNRADQNLPTLSACIISYNEEHNIADCIDSVSWCDEVVVIDSFSEDHTADIARGRGARVLQNPWPGHVAQKNHALDTARSEWVLALDCDERVTPTLRTSIQHVLASPREVDGYYIARKIFYLGRWLDHGGWFPEWRLRLFRRTHGRWVGTDPHDTVRVSGETRRIIPSGRGTDAAVILHYSFRNLSHQLHVLDRYTEIQSGELLRSGRRIKSMDLTVRPIWRFLRAYCLRLGFLDGAPGFHMAFNNAYAAYMKYARLWELQKGFVKARSKESVLPSLPESENKPQS